MEWQAFTTPVPDTSHLEPVDQEQFRKVVQSPIPPDWIRHKDVGNGRMRPYVPGARIRQLVDEATGGRYVWEILGIHYRKANDRIVKDYRTKEERVIPQPHYVVVIGRLTIPGIGTRIGVGTDVLWDSEDATGQANAFKAAATDAFKVAASGFGFARELYLDDSFDEEEAADGNGSRSRSASRPARASSASSPISPAQAAQLAQLKRQLKVSTVEQLNRLIAEWGAKSGTGAKTMADLNGENIDPFLAFLQSKTAA